MSTISPITQFAYDTSTAAPQNRIPTKTLDQNDFLKLLVTQMTTQDPMSPKSDSEFVAQMASFTTLEQSKSMSADIAQLRADQQLMKANSLIGRTVAIQVDGETTHTGMVAAVHVEAGTPKVEVDGIRYTLDQLLAIAPTLITNQTSTQ